MDMTFQIRVGTGYLYQHCALDSASVEQWVLQEKVL
jgi:hypothetical protein